ncbi:MAG TPA: hypothetical protein PK478_02855 [Nitrospira sp.]|jgi:hypothetical protein|nr:hypothetical protein [Nitrospira sp.]HQW88759.1 hypothetical protein [Nitrospira sp.]HQZ90470.1 hypothetical protein [Thermomicrobiales bacterium]HRA32652.1 hypothetical protein [Thermomicrobiales bacterium]
MAREKVYVDRDGNVVEADDPSAAFIYDAADAKRLGYARAVGEPAVDEPAVDEPASEAEVLTVTDISEKKRG